MDLAADDIRAAAQRLRGQIVRTPLIGGVMLPVARLDNSTTDLHRCPRLKAECLQAGGSIEFRGALHFLLRQLGSLKGLVIRGPKEVAMSRVLAGHTLRLPMLVAHPLPLGGHRDLIESWGGELVADPLPPDELARSRGFCLLPHVEDADYACGIATVGFELASEMPSDVERVYVSPPELAPAITAGLRAQGHGARAFGVDVDREKAPPLQPGSVGQALVDIAKIRCDDLGAAALSRALRDGAGDESCVVLSC